MLQTVENKKKKKKISPDFEEMETSSIRFESKEKIFEKV